MQEENNESSFEFVEKKSSEVVSLSNIAPPSELPSFLMSSSSSTTVPSTSVFSSQSEFHPTTFTPAIPVDTPVIPKTPKPITPNKELPESQEESGGSLFSWVKDTVSQQSQSILSKVAEKAKNSVDSMITTLDPQMRDFIGTNKADLTITVASDKEVKISPVREAFHGLFPSAAVRGIGVYPRCAAQPVGFEAATLAANSRVRTLREMHEIVGPVVVVESFIVEIRPDKWYEANLIVLDDDLKECNLETYSQMIPVPSGIVEVAQTDTPADYEHKATGYSVTIGSLMAKNLETDHTEWQMALTGVPRRQMILTAAKIVANLYKTVVS
ncbi:hypothetical protein M8J75_008475 [Diaphorina citri]|nr:hypothetical protein M8J75_008475 [Diaphorina citri]KAI5750792.1 hypothetical protein M8J77_001319 [Diaphorina citri]